MEIPWRLVEDHLKERISSLRQKNDDQKIDPIETAAIRAEIAACKNLLNLPARLAAQKAMAPDGE